MPSSTASVDSDEQGLSSTPTPHSHFHRTMTSSTSASSQPQWSPNETPRHHHQGTSYFGGAPQSAPRLPSSSSGRPRPILITSASAASVQNRNRSRSISSSTSRSFHEDGLSEAGEDEERRARRGKAAVANAEEDEEEDEDANGGGNADDEEEDEDERDLDPITLKERQSMINVEHPFGLPIWKPALYQKSRSVTRYADQALHSVPSAQAERHLLPGNIFWVIVFGWWLSLACLLLSGLLRIVPYGGRRYSSLAYGLGWYLVWPFGKYVEGDVDPEELEEGQLDGEEHERNFSEDSSVPTVRANSSEQPQQRQRDQSASWNDISAENTPLIQGRPPRKSYGVAVYHNNSRASSESSDTVPKIYSHKSDVLGKACFWLGFVCIIAPLMLFVCLVCWGLVVTIPMAKLNWALLKHLFQHPTTIRFCSAPPAVVVSAMSPSPEDDDDDTPTSPPQFAVKHPRISPGQLAPSGYKSAKVLLCVYRAVGMKYYKYTVGGVNILFVNLMPVVFFVIFDGIVLLRMVEHYEEHGKRVPPLLATIAAPGLIFFLSLLSVIPLSYFIGMAVASISAQSSIGMGAVINATFGSIIEILLYAIALTQKKGHLVEGSIVGSLLAGVLLMPGASMVSSAVRRKEQKFNAKSAGVTSMMLIMAIIGILTPTLFYQTYGNFQLTCTGCPDKSTTTLQDTPWTCEHCYYEHPDPVADPFYQNTVKNLMYFCAIVLVLSYLIGLWFSLRTHASQIWQKPTPPKQNEVNQNRQSVYHKITAPVATLARKASQIGFSSASRPTSPLPRERHQLPGSPTLPRRVSYAHPPRSQPIADAVKSTGLELPAHMTADDFSRAVAVATVSALRQQQQTAMHSPARVRTSAAAAEEHEGGHGGHDAPSWSRGTSASVLLACTALYAIIAEILVDVVDAILQGSGIDEKFLGVTLFALVPNTTEFMNAMSFALNGNIALSMEIGSAYALQVCLLQIPAMVAFSAWYAPERMGEVATTFTLVFPRWDVIVIILSMFLMTYTYIEARSNYHRGSILIMSYLVMVAGFYLAPGAEDDKEDEVVPTALKTVTKELSVGVWEYARWYVGSWW